MTTLFNNPADFAEDQFTGFLDLYADRLRGVPGGAVAHRGDEPIVAVVIGGGSGHYPAFCGLVGPGFASGAVVGNIFTSPSAAQVYSVAKAADQGRGVVLSFGNYAGDVMNFGIAAQRLRREGIDTRIVLVTDDVASSAIPEQRRGIAGDFTVFKVLGAAAASGLSLDEVEELGVRANAATRSFGVAFSGCTMPGAETALFSVPEGHMGVGLGIHGEPGIHDEPLVTGAALARILFDGVLAARPVSSSNRVGVIVNGLGTTKYEELFLLWGSLAPMLREAGLEPVDAEVGEQVTSLDMGGVSLTLTWLDDDLERAWTAPTYTPAYRKDRRALAGLRRVSVADAAADDTVAPTPSPAGAVLAPVLVAGLERIAAILRDAETELGRLDAVAGDGDHGRGMVRGSEAARTATATAAGGPSWLLHRAGRAWATEAGGTSGVLWGAGLEAAGDALTDTADGYGTDAAARAAEAFTAAITELGGAEPGDKTIVDALLPFTAALRSGADSGAALAQAWEAAAIAADRAALATAALSPKRGRARPLAEKSVGTPDPGATSFALIVRELARTHTERGIS